ncbi:hypothetical protein B0H14DRAFT_3513252 [Mycena olivaceomarginata]|nr:hypothetical protein B0H14DRAFT_3513252 [Mycena olivaceomarginata]
MAPGQKRPRKRVPREEHSYADALDKGWVAERKYWRKVCNEYHARIDWRTKDHEEPEIRDWDATDPLPTESLSDEEKHEQRTRMKVLNKRIRRWFKYRIKRLRKRTGSGGDPTKDPFAVLLAQLSGVTSPPGKARQSYQQFMHERYEEDVAPAVMARWALEKDERAAAGEANKTPKADFRAAVARDIFAALPTETQKEFGAKAKKSAEEARTAYKKRLTDPPSQAPGDRQKCIDAIPEFMAPILQGIYAHTGCHATIIVGGPMPKFGGELRTVHVSYGSNRTAAGDHWAQWDKSRFAANVSGYMIEYLRTAYTTEDCARAALTGKEPGRDAPGPSGPPPPAEDSDNDSAFPDEPSDDDKDEDEEEEGEEGESRAPKKRRVTRKKSAREALDVAMVGDPTGENGEGEGGGHNEGGGGGSDGEEGPDERTQEEIDNHLRWEENRRNEMARQAVIARNRERLEAIKRMYPIAPPTPKPAREARAKVARGPPVRRSQRQAEAAGTEVGSTNDDAGDGRSDRAHEERDPPTPTGITTETGSTAQGRSTSTAPGGALALVSCPSSAPTWFSEAHAKLTAIDIGPHYAAVVAAWTRLEEASRFEQGPTNLPSKNRPKEVTAWISSGRKQTSNTEVSEPAEFADTWYTWWDLLQPAWRRQEGDGVWSTSSYGEGGREWGPLYQWGVNGTLSIVASLYFWGCAVRGKEELRTRWEAALSDVVWMLEGMATYYEKFEKKF